MKYYGDGVPQKPIQICRYCAWWNELNDDEGTCVVKTPGKKVYTVDTYQCHKFEQNSPHIRKEKNSADLDNPFFQKFYDDYSEDM